MTITHDGQIDFQVSGRPFAQTIMGAGISVFRTIRKWHADALQKRATSKLPARLQLDIGEIDHMPTRTPTFLEAGPASYQDRLELMWLR